MCSHDGQILSKEFQDSVHNAALRVRDPKSDAVVRSYPCTIILAARRIVPLLLSALATALCPIAVFMLLTFFYRFEKEAEKRVLLYNGRTDNMWGACGDKIKVLPTSCQCLTHILPSPTKYLHFACGVTIEAIWG